MANQEPKNEKTTIELTEHGKEMRAKREQQSLINLLIGVGIALVIIIVLANGIFNTIVAILHASPVIIALFLIGAIVWWYVSKILK